MPRTDAIYNVNSHMAVRHLGESVTHRPTEAEASSSAAPSGRACNANCNSNSNSNASSVSAGAPGARAVCEARSEVGEANSTQDGAELFREEGTEGPQGPGVPEGAVAGVIVLQPDGSPCIGWLVAHPAIVRPLLLFAPAACPVHEPSSCSWYVYDAQVAYSATRGRNTLLFSVYLICRTLQCVRTSRGLPGFGACLPCVYVFHACTVTQVWSLPSDHYRSLLRSLLDTRHGSP